MRGAKLRRLRIPALVVGLLAVPVGNWSSAGESGPATGVEHVQASVAGSDVIVQGTARFVDLPVQVGTDPSGDAQVSGRGADVVAATISRPDPFANELRFSLGVADLPSDAPAIGVDHIWCLEVLPDGIDSPPGQHQRHMLHAYRKSDGAAGFRATSANGCTLIYGGPTISGATGPDPGAISGSIGQGAVTFAVPFQKMAGVKPGALIRHYEYFTNAIQGDRIGQVGSSLGALGFEWYGSLDTIAVAEYVVPAPTVRIGVAPAGTPPEQVPLTATATVLPDSSFRGMFPLEEIPPGDHVVVAEACYGEENCGHAATSLSV